MENDQIIGQRFSQVYLERGTALHDSMRLRNRLTSAFETARKSVSIDFAKLIQFETGALVPWGPGGRDWSGFWTRSDLRDVLDSITIVFAAVGGAGYSSMAKQWRDTVARFFEEENVGYRVDSQAGVHFAVDECFERERVTTLAGLSAAEYSAVRANFSEAFGYLDKSPPEARAAVRAIFDALENLIKQWFPKKISRLGSSEIEKVVKPAVLTGRTGSDRNSAALMLDGLGNWVNAGHQYRHAEGKEEVAPPPLSTAVLFISTGASYLRWLIAIRDSAIDG